MIARMMIQVQLSSNKLQKQFPFIYFPPHDCGYRRSSSSYVERSGGVKISGAEIEAHGFHEAAVELLRSIMPHLFERANKVVCTGKPFYYYCENPGSITHEAYNEKKRIVIKHIKEVSSYIASKYPELKEAVGEFQGRYASGFLFIFEQQGDSNG